MHPAKVGWWSLLVVVSIVLVAGVKAHEGRLYGTSDDLTVLRAARWRPARREAGEAAAERTAAGSVH